MRSQRRRPRRWPDSKAAVSTALGIAGAIALGAGLGAAVAWGFSKLAPIPPAPPAATFTPNPTPDMTTPNPFTLTELSQQLSACHYDATAAAEAYIAAHATFLQAADNLRTALIREREAQAQYTAALPNPDQTTQDPTHKTP